VAAQIAVLLALIAGLFDPVPLERMAEAERAVRQVAGQLPAGVAERLEGADSLSTGDRETILALVRQALETLPLNPGPQQAPRGDVAFQPHPGTRAGASTSAPQSGRPGEPI